MKRTVVLAACAALAGSPMVCATGFTVPATGSTTGTITPASFAAAAAPLPQHPGQVEVAPGTLQSALAAAASGETLVLVPGIHPGPVRVEVPVTLEGRPGAVIEGTGTGTVVTVAADGATLRRLEIRGSGADLSTDDATVLVMESEGVRVEDCDVRARGFGIYLRGGGDHVVVGNRVVGDASLPEARRGNGVHLWHSVRNQVVDNRVERVRDGVYLSFAHDNRIVGNEGARLRYGIHYMYSERNELERNRFVDGVGGIALMFSLRNSIVGNVTEGNREFGILCQQLERSVLSDNRTRGNGRGLYLQNSARNRFVGNRVRGNGIGVYLTAASEGNVFTANGFHGNLVQVHREHAGVNRWSDDGRGNYWSDYAGFDWNGDGVGDAPYRLETAASVLLARRPSARWLWMSPVLELLDWWESRLLRPRPGALDPHPLVRLPGGRQAEAGATGGSVGAP